MQRLCLNYAAYIVLIMYIIRLHRITEEFIYSSLTVIRKSLSRCIDHTVNFLGSFENSISENSISPICRGCGKIFLWGEHLEMHKQKSGCGIERKNECIYCGQGFIWKINLQRHINGIHLKLLKTKSLWYSNCNFIYPVTPRYLFFEMIIILFCMVH